MTRWERNFVPDLIAKPALGAAPLTIAGTTLSENGATQITAIAPYPGSQAALAQALRPLGLTFPAPNQFTEHGDVRLAWSGRDQAFLIGGDAPADLPAAVTDQSDAWVSLQLAGPQARAVLARYVPLDLRAASRGLSLRSALNHLPLLLMVEAPDSYTLMTFRSMARTAWAELHEALIKVEARLALT
jgi:heterotetrameric sarcosine oxidase gamma subunit